MTAEGNEIRIPFRVGADVSRTWILSDGFGAGAFVVVDAMLSSMYAAEVTRFEKR